MTTLKEQYDAIKAQLGKMGFSQDKIALMHRATDELRNSGAMERILRVGDRAPEFNLHSAAGTMVNSRDILARGPMVLTFYRGVW
jgi:hypothetical protein